MPYKAPDHQRHYQAIWMWRRRLRWILDNGPCTECGSTRDLQVVHKNPAEGKVRVTSIWSRRDEVREELLAKCVVLCKECSWIKWRGLRQPEHGTNSRYSQGCKCPPCRAAHSVHNRKYRKRPVRKDQVGERMMAGYCHWALPRTLSHTG